MHTSTNPGEIAALSTAEFATVIGIGLSTAKTLVAQGVIRSFRVGRRVLIPRVEIANFIENRLKESNTTP